VEEGEQVSPGAVLAVLEGREAARIQLDLATAQKKRAEHQRQLRKDALAVERGQSDRTRQPRLDAAKKLAEISKERFTKGSALYNQFGATLQGRDRFDAENALFQVEVQSIRADLEAKLLEAGLDAEQRKRQVEDRELADGADFEVLDRQIDLARTALDQTESRAPQAGRILKILARPGEISAGPILQMGDVSRMVATAEVYQSDVPAVQVGDPAEVILLGQRVAGQVTRIGSLVGKNQLTSVDPRALRDLRVVLVTIQLDDSTIASRYVNMEVEVVIRPSGSASTPPVQGTSSVH
jgi:HlyD family secretion protein